MSDPKIIDLAYKLVQHDHEAAIDLLNKLGVTYNRCLYMIPERDPDSTGIGHATRGVLDGKKGCVKGSKRGLTYIAPIDPYAGSSPDEPIIVIEGMTDWLVASMLGFTAIGRPSASGGADMLIALLKDRHVVVVSENDTSGTGQREAPKLARKLVRGGCASVKVIFPPEGVKDLREWFNAPAPVTRDELLALIRVTNPVKADDDVIEQRDDETNDKPSQAERLVRLALERYRIGRTDAGEAFAVEKDGPNVAIMFRGSRDALRSTLAREFRRIEGTTPNASALADALTALHGEALDAESEPVHLRVAEHDGSIVIDLGRADGKVVLVRSGVWEVLDPSPVLFRRTALTGELPLPVPGGDLQLLRDLLNVTDESWPLVIGFMVAALIPSIPHPIALLGGEQGAGKSTGARHIVALIDPSAAPLRSQPRDPEGWAMTASGSWAVVLDNISAIPAWLSDALCKAVTGDGWVRRALYTDSDLAVLTFRRVVMLTSIDAGALRGDLGDRLLLIDLHRIPEAQRRGEVELDRLFAERRPLIFGALLDLLASVLIELPKVELDTLPRMADFARVLAAVDTVTGGDSLNTYSNQRGRIAGDVIEADPVALAVVKLTDHDGSWSGTSGELLTRITPERPPKGWPANGQAMTGRLKRLIPALGQTGITVTIPDTRTRHGRIITITRNPAGGDDMTIPDVQHHPSVRDDDHNDLLLGDLPSEGSRKTSSPSSHLSPTGPDDAPAVIGCDDPTFGGAKNRHPDRHTEIGSDGLETPSGDDGDNCDDLLHPSSDTPTIDPDDWSVYAIDPVTGTWSDL